MLGVYLKWIIFAVMMCRDWRWTLVAGDVGGGEVWWQLRSGRETCHCSGCLLGPQRLGRRSRCYQQPGRVVPAGPPACTELPGPVSLLVVCHDTHTHTNTPNSFHTTTSHPNFSQKKLTSINYHLISFPMKITSYFQLCFLEVSGKLEEK